MSRTFLLGLALMSTIVASAQQEKVYLSLDRYRYRAGDTIWMKAFVMAEGGLSGISTNLYVQLYAENRTIIISKVLPIVNGSSIGQIFLDESLPTENYYLVAFTRAQLDDCPSDLFSIPLFIYNKQKPNRNIFHKSAIRADPSLTSGNVFDNLWITSIKGDSVISNVIKSDRKVGEHSYDLFYRDVDDSIAQAHFELGGVKSTQYCIFKNVKIGESKDLYLYEDSALVGHQHMAGGLKKDSIIVDYDTLDTNANGYNAWTIHLPDTTKIFSATISVTDSIQGGPAPVTIASLDESFTEDLTLKRQIDSNYLSFEGHATRTLGRKIKDVFDRQIFVAGVKDTTYLWTRLVDLDENGNFKMTGLTFYDTIALHFGINHLVDVGNTKDVALKMHRYIPPVLDADDYADSWKNDSMNPISHSDTTLSIAYIDTWGLKHMRVLAPVVVKAWKNPRKELDSVYTTGVFSEAGEFAMDVRKYTSPYFRHLGDYLELMTSLAYDPVNDDMKDRMGHPLRFFVDEQAVTQDWAMHMVDFEDIAYIKIVTSDAFSFPPPEIDLLSKKDTKIVSPGQIDPTPRNVCIYLRKGKDLRTRRGYGMNHIIISGYSQPVQFSPNDATVYWNPSLIGHQARIRFTNPSAMKNFRVRIEGIDNHGRPIRYEKLIR